MANERKSSKDKDKYIKSNDERHSENARAAAESQPITPKFSTENL
jgi:hypothetical protein